MLIKLYFLGIILLTFFVIALYIVTDRGHQKEMDKIVAYETKEHERQKELDKLRMQTTVCPYDNLCNPRDCYFKSDYKCSWNEDTERCDLRR